VAEKKTKAGRLKPLLMIVLVFGPALFLIFIALNKCEHKFTTLPVYGKLTNYSFDDANGGVVDSESQQGKITLFNTIQTSCPENCAIDLPKFNLMIYQDYRKNQRNLGHVKIVSIVTDQQGNPVSQDMIEELKYTMKDIVESYDPNIWKLVTGDPKQIYDIESNGINLYTKTSDTAFAGKSFLETMLIVDKKNQLRLIRRGSEEGMIRDYKQHVALLQKQYDKEAAKREENEEK
jgi:cytochrome oxidase Cu insertion factor (SCO1/SenC/PrrC family)